MRYAVEINSNGRRSYHMELKLPATANIRPLCLSRPREATLYRTREQAEAVIVMTTSWPDGCRVIEVPNAAEWRKQA